MYDSALAYAKAEKTPEQISREGVASLYRAAGMYQLARKASDSATKAKEHYQAALGVLATRSTRSERDAVLMDVAQAVLDGTGTGKTDPAVERGEKLDPDETQKLLTGVLRTMTDLDARRLVIRSIGERLIARNEADRALALAGLGFSQPVERAEAQSIVGLELLRVGKKEEAEHAIDVALQAYPGTGAPTPMPAVVALALMTERKAPRAPTGSLDAENEVLGKVEALIRQGKGDEARALAVATPDPRLSYRRLVTLAQVTAGTDAQDVEAATKMLEGPLRGNPNVSAWSVYQLVHLGAQAKVSSDRLREIARLANDRDLRGRGQLLALKQELSAVSGVQPVPGPMTEKFEADGLARLLATELLCRHNGLMNSSWGNDIQGWEEKLRAFGALGLLQGRYSSR
jgi:tetratricopeptide (TPR) repeat protein